MLGFIISALKIIFLLGFLILIHEGGHFLIAKLCKVRVNEFAIGFGPTIWRKQGKETKYALRLIPLGGFVSMEGEDTRSDKEGSFSKASIPRRIAIVLAGGMVNIIFGVVIYFALVSFQGEYITNKVEQVMPDYTASYEVLQPEDEIIRINKQRIRTQQDINEAMAKSEGKEIIVQIKRNNQLQEVKIRPEVLTYKSTGIYLGVADENISTKIIALYPNSPAEKAGIQANDVILKINGQEVSSDPYKVVEIIEKAEGNVVFTLQRKKETMDITVEPQILEEYKLGVTLAKAEKNFVNNVYYGFWDTKEFAFSIIDNLKMLFSGQVRANQLMGPVGISEMVAKTNGLADFINILALISLSLGVTNLLPFPPLDGGKIVLLLIEAVRRKPLKENVEIGIQMLGFTLIILLSLYVTYHDILRIF